MKNIPVILCMIGWVLLALVATSIYATSKYNLGKEDGIYFERNRWRNAAEHKPNFLTIGITTYKVTIFNEE